MLREFYYIYSYSLRVLLVGLSNLGRTPKALTKCHGRSRGGRWVAWIRGNGSDSVSYGGLIYQYRSGYI